MLYDHIEQILVGPWILIVIFWCIEARGQRTRLKNSHLGLSGVFTGFKRPQLWIYTKYRHHMASDPAYIFKRVEFLSFWVVTPNIDQ